MPGLGGGIEDQRDDIHLAQRLHRRVHHAHVEPVQGPVNPRRIDEHDLPAFKILRRDDPIPGRLRLVGDDRDLGADDAVEEGGLAGVGAADQGGESGARHGGNDVTF